MAMDPLDDHPRVYFVTDHESHDAYQDNDNADGPLYSESSSGRTMSTLGSVEIPDYFRNLHGFQYTADENLPIVFPNDSRAERLNVLVHTIMKLCQEGKNVPKVVDEELGGDSINRPNARVLDLATESGTWALEMAEMYPNATFLSLDVKPLVAFEPHSRITFEVYDFYAGIAESDASFDVIHVRQCVTMAKDYNFLLRELHRVLKPGGVLVISEMPIQSYEVDNPSTILYSAPRRAAGIRILRGALQSQGIDIAAWEDMSTRLDPGHPMWKNQIPTATEKNSDAEVVHGFHTITHRAHLIPSGPWPNDEGQRIIGALARLLFTDVYRAMLPLLLIMGMDEVGAQGMVDGLLEELLDPNYTAYVKHHVWCARKI